MRAILADDEAPARRRLMRLLEEFDDLEVVGQASDGVEALEQVDTLHPDVLFLDIRMPELDGFGVVNALAGSAHLPLVIFATSFDDHALEAFNANAIAYLLKPVEPERLALALTRARHLLGSEQERKAADASIQTVAAVSKKLHRIVCRKGSRVLLVAPSDVLWFYLEDGIVHARTAGETYWVNYQLNQLETGLNPEQFFRARRELLVNLLKVKVLKPYDRSTFMLVMNDATETELLVSERQAKDLRARFPGL